MSRVARDKRPYIRPVKKIEISNKNSKRRIILAALLLLFGFSVLCITLTKYLSSNDGWSEICVDGSADANYGNEFVFLYNLGVSGQSATVENKALTMQYTKYMVDAYKLFNCYTNADSLANVLYINQHPNEEIEVDEALYNAFSMIQENESRYLYMAPIYDLQDDMFDCQDDTQASEFDPMENPDVASECVRTLSYVNDKKSVDIELLGSNKIRLNVSDEYIAYAKDNFIERYIDFNWMKNAFIIDYVAESLISDGFTKGSISSYDGFVRNLDDSSDQYSMNFYDYTDGQIYNAAIFQYTGKRSVVAFRSFPINSRDKVHYYSYKNGRIASAYLDNKDGISKNSLESLMLHSKETGCAEMVLKAAPFYISDSFDEAGLKQLADTQIDIAYSKDKTIYSTGSDAKFVDLYNTDGVNYSVSEIE